MKKQLNIFCTILVLFSSHLTGQYEDRVLRYDEFISQIKSYHPLIQQLNLYDQKSDAYAKKARGGFDPKLDFDYFEKSYDEKDYYDKLQGKLKIPLWYGIDIESGYELSNGEFLNPENSLPQNGLIYAGLKIPLGNGLVYNERRKILDEAKLIRVQNELDRIEKYNSIMLKASHSFAKWQVVYEKQLLFERVLKIAEERFENVKYSFQEGAIPAIDTLEAKLNVENRKLDLNKTLEKVNEARLNLSFYLWADNFVPIEIADDVFPEVLNTSQWKENVNEILIQQVDLIQNTTHVKSLENENQRIDLRNRLTKESLKPVFNLRINPLVGLEENELAFSQNDYKIGAEFSYPILNRKTRGDLELIKLEKIENRIERVALKQNLDIQLNKNINSLQFVESRFEIAQQNAAFASQLLDAETEKFAIGESSIFLINAREQKKISYQEKALDLKVKLVLEQLNIIGLTQQFD